MDHGCSRLYCGLGNCETSITMNCLDDAPKWTYFAFTDFDIFTDLMVGNINGVKYMYCCSQINLYRVFILSCTLQVLLAKLPQVHVKLLTASCLFFIIPYQSDVVQCVCSCLMQKLLSMRYALKMIQYHSSWCPC